MGENGGGPILGFQNFYKCSTFLGGKKQFFSKSAPIMHWEWRIIKSELAFLSMEESMSGQQQTEALEASS